MIIAERKPLAEIIAMIGDNRRILLVGCRSCAAVCMAGGDREVAALAEALRLYAQVHTLDWKISETAVERQCEKEWAKEVGEMADCELILSLGCGVGVQFLQEASTVPVFPALNTSNMGGPEEQGIYLEKCGGCGDCTLHLTGGICPVARCAKSLLNGPCGGSQDGKCEVNPDTPCAWQAIYDSLQRLQRLSLLKEIIPPKDWRSSHAGGPRKIVRPQMVLSEDEKKIKEGLE